MNKFYWLRLIFDSESSTIDEAVVYVINCVTPQNVALFNNRGIGLKN